jgi:small subunit ribosomal protein S2
VSLCVFRARRLHLIPREVEYVIPANDDASKSIDKILSLVAAIVEGLSDRGLKKER